MKKSLRVIGLVAVAAGVLYYPAMKLYQYVAKKRSEKADDNGDNHETEHPHKAFTPSYRGKHKPHHRHAEANGQAES